MKVTSLAISDILVIEPQVFEDERGFFYESFNLAHFECAVRKS
jgi:dTDP-4-dehydrorhamnose 3,5-epimerase